jgi:Na+-driven multidrug efflux pump
MTFKKSIISIYTSDENVITIALAAMTAFSFALFPDSIVFAYLGIFRGLG